MVERIQNEFGDRLERILGSGGGLLAVVNLIDEQDELLAREISGEVPVAVITPATLSGLQRLGAVPVTAGETPVLFEAPDQPEINPLLKMAEEKLNAAELLIENGCHAGVMELLASALLSGTSALAGSTKLQTEEEANLWIYSNALPQGLLTSEQSAAIARTFSLKHSIEIPESLIYQSLEDARLITASHFESLKPDR